MRQILTLMCACVALTFSSHSLDAEESFSSTPAKTTERTLLLIKPNAVAAGNVGSILQRVECAGLRIIGLKIERLSKEQAEVFYAEHKARPFYPSLVTFMSSGPLVAVALEGPNAVSSLRTLLGATNPAEAKRGTIRADFGKSVQENAVHGSDSVNSALRELRLFFSEQPQ